MPESLYSDWNPTGTQWASAPANDLSTSPWVCVCVFEHILLSFFHSVEQTQIKEKRLNLKGLFCSFSHSRKVNSTSRLIHSFITNLYQFHQRLTGIFVIFYSSFYLTNNLSAHHWKWCLSQLYVISKTGVFSPFFLITWLKLNNLFSLSSLTDVCVTGCKA